MLIFKIGSVVQWLRSSPPAIIERITKEGVELSDGTFLVQHEAEMLKVLDV